MSTEAAAHADFSRIRYAQLWEDADILVEALDVRPGDRCLSIASAGDNALALLTRNPESVLAVDLSPAQIACLELRVAAFRRLSHPELLTLLGARPEPGAEEKRWTLFERIRPDLSESARRFWQAQPDLIRAGAATVGKFERYFELFRHRVMPLIHGRRTITRLLAGGTRAERERFYVETWNNWRWRLLFQLFFSRFAMGRLGRDPAFFRYVEGSVADRILARTRHALVELNPAENPYLHTILTGGCSDALPCAWRAENFEVIRANLPRMSWRVGALEDVLAGAGRGAFTKFNLSDIFEYMSESAHAELLGRLCEVSQPGGRLVYWNMLAPRRRPDALAHRLAPRDDLARALHPRDRAFFYSALVVEDVLA
jgi:S-adenosylmethionine-diacylglycerol 3-amino-3-carboxypropyl transferase